MCLSPIRLLSKKVIYKGVEKSILFWHTSSYEYERGFVTLSADDDRLSYSLFNQIKKYNLSFPITFDVRLELPCRKCLECTKSRAKEWSLRCSLEASNYDCNYFVTLTYNNKYLPYNNFYSWNADENCFTKKSVPTLKKEHCFAFMKHLRTVFKREFNHDGIRFFMCGEYGTKNLRPHYHFNIFNLPLNDLYLYSTSKSGYPIYRSPTLERCWKFGFVTVKPFTTETARYTAQYCCKKMNKNQSALSGRLMEYVNMSRRGGIGSLYFYKNCDKLLSKVDGTYCDCIYLSNSNSKGEYYSEKFSCPSAFYRLLKPLTDSSRGIDTEFVNDIAFVLNNDNVFLYDAYKECIADKQIYSENKLSCDMSKLGYDYSHDRFSDKYLSFLTEKSIDILSKFPILRDRC